MGEMVFFSSRASLPEAGEHLLEEDKKSNIKMKN